MTNVRLRTYASALVGLSGSGSVVAEPTRNTAAIASLTAFVKGADGSPGLSGGATTVLAGQALGGQRVVTVTGFHASPADANAIAGITKAAGLTGTAVEIVVQGLMSEPSWTWTPAAPVFVGLLGVLTQLPPVSGNLRRVAWALSATTINVDLSPTITQA